MKSCKICNNKPATNQDYIWCDTPGCPEHNQKYYSFEWHQASSIKMEELCSHDNLNQFTTVFNGA